MKTITKEELKKIKNINKEKNKSLKEGKEIKK